MPIQFHCPGCGQPIEVDDDAANQPVTCPYCRRTSTAPAATATNFDPQARAVQAHAVHSPGASPQRNYPPMGAPGVGPIPEVNRLAWWSLGLVTASILLMIPLMIMLASVRAQVPTTQDARQDAENVTATLKEHVGFQVLSTTAVCLLPLAATIIGAIALFGDRKPKWPAYTALGIIGASVLLMCLITILMASMGAGA